MNRATRTEQREPSNEQYITYSLTCPAFPGSVALFYYTLHEKELTKVTFNQGASSKFKWNMAKMFPVTPGAFKHEYFKECQVKDITHLDLSFNKWWETYGYKVGRKNKCEAIWKKLSTEEKIMALGFINPLRRFYEQKKYDFPYPETYINGRYWESVIR